MKTKQVVAVAFAILFSLSTLTLIANDKKVEKKENVKELVQKSADKSKADNKTADCNTPSKDNSKKAECTDVKTSDCSDVKKADAKKADCNSTAKKADAKTTEKGSCCNSKKEEPKK